MNERERFREAILFGKPDKVPFSPGWPRESTLRRWHSEGLPKDGWFFDHLCREIGVKREPATKPWAHHGVDLLMIPQFEEKVIERRGDSLIVQDWKGNICEISSEFDPSYLRNAKDFVTRRWIKCPVENRDDWAAIKERYNPADPRRFPADFDARCQTLAGRDYLANINISGPFWQLREWCGFEGLCILMIEDPAFVHEMIDFWEDFVLRTIRPLLGRVQLDGVHLSEDMAYKAHSMISPAMVREFLLPTWTRWASEAHTSGCPVVDMDSDGFVGELIPLWIEAGIDCCDPMEVAAGNNIVEFRRRFGRQIAFTGGIDKRAMAKGGDVIRAEVERVVPPLLEDGGFIPSCDHAVPSDVSWPDFIDYSRLLAQYTGWR